MNLLKIASILSIFESLKGKADALYSRAENLESYLRENDPVKYGKFVESLFRIAKTTLGPKFLKELALTNELVNQEGLNVYFLLHELGHLFVEPTYRLNRFDIAQSDRPKIEEDIDEVVNLTLTGHAKGDGGSVFAPDAYVGYRMSDLLNMLEQSTNPNPEKRKAYRNLARQFRVRYPDLVDLDIEASHFGPDESKLAKPTFVLRDLVYTFKDRLADIYKRDLDSSVSEVAIKYKNLLFGIERLISEFEKEIKQTPKVAFADTIAESSKTSIKRLDSWHASEDYSIDHAYDFVTSLYPPERSYHFKGYEILKKLQFYVFCLDVDSKTVPISKMTLEPFLDGHQVTFIAIKDAYKGKQISQIMYEFAATLGPLYSDTTQTTEARKAWLKLLQSGHDIELVHSSNGEKVDVPLYPDTQAREISSGSDDFPVYGTFDYILKLSKS